MGIFQQFLFFFNRQSIFGKIVVALSILFCFFCIFGISIPALSMPSNYIKSQTAIAQTPRYQPSLNNIALTPITSKTNDVSPMPTAEFILENTSTITSTNTFTFTPIPTPSLIITAVQTKTLLPTTTYTVTPIPTTTFTNTPWKYPTNALPTTDLVYTPLAGHIFTGVKVYYGVNKAYGFEILGGSENCSLTPSGRGLYVLMPNGSREWKDRLYLINSGIYFVKNDDPALLKMVWYEYSCR